MSAKWVWLCEPGSDYAMLRDEDNGSPVIQTTHDVDPETPVAKLIARAPDLADTLEAAADTLRDAGATYHFFGKHIAAKAMELAEKHCRAALRAAGRLGVREE